MEQLHLEPVPPQVSHRQIEYQIEKFLEEHKFELLKQEPLFSSVDFIIKDKDGNVIAIEVKSNRYSFQHLTQTIGRAKDQFDNISRFLLVTPDGPDTKIGQRFNDIFKFKGLKADWIKANNLPSYLGIEGDLSKYSVKTKILYKYAFDAVFNQVKNSIQPDSDIDLSEIRLLYRQFSPDTIVQLYKNCGQQSVRLQPKLDT